MSAVRLVLISLAFFVLMAYAQPAPGAPAIDPSLPGGQVAVAQSEAVGFEPKPRTAVLLLPLLFPTQFYWG